MGDPCLDRLQAGDPEGAWNLFLDRYRRLIFAVIRRYTVEPDEVMDAFAAICDQLHADDLARLRRYHGETASSAKFSTWLVVVLRNLLVDWHRQRHGRPRRVAPDALSSIGKVIYHRVMLEHRSHVETYEIIRQRLAPTLSHAEFLRELREVHRIAFVPARSALRAVPESEVPDASPPADHEIAASEDALMIRRALEELPDDLRLAVQLYVIDGLAAADVARIVGWPNAKSVYNRVSHAMARLRERLGPSLRGDH
jgi:RNA polymerase sigma factor (sigma-70 family)